MISVDLFIVHTFKHYDYGPYDMMRVNGRSSLTAIPKRVMPCFSQSAMTVSLRDRSWDSPSVTTTITLEAPGRAPLFWLKPCWLKRADTVDTFKWLFVVLSQNTKWLFSLNQVIIKLIKQKDKDTDKQSIIQILTVLKTRNQAGQQGNITGTPTWHIQLRGRCW